MNERPDSYKSFLGYVFSNKRTVKILYNIVLFYMIFEFFINSNHFQRIGENLGFSVCPAGKIRHVIILIMLVPLSWILLASINNYLNYIHNKSFWRYVFASTGLLKLYVMSVSVIEILICINATQTAVRWVMPVPLLWIFLYSIHYYYYAKYKHNNNSLSIENNNDKPLETPHFTRIFSKTEQKKLYDGLTADGFFLPEDTDFENFCSVFRTKDYEDTGKPFSPLIWQKSVSLLAYFVDSLFVTDTRLWEITAKTFLYKDNPPNRDTMKSVVSSYKNEYKDRPLSHEKIDIIIKSVKLID
jgi:hypothetical protein